MKADCAATGTGDNVWLIARFARMLLSTALVMGAACSDDVPATAVDLEIDAGACTSAMTDRVVVRVFSAEDELVETFEGTEFPTGVQLVPRGGDATRAWAIEAEVLDAAGVSLSFQRAHGTYSEGSVRELALPFDDACLGISCRADESCRQGECVDALEPMGVGAPTLGECPAFVWVDGAAGTDGEGCEDASNPCATIQHALDLLRDGTTGYVMNVHGGSVYTASPGQSVANIDESPNRGAEDRRVLRAWPGTGRPVIDATGNDKGLLAGDSFVVIDGFEIHSADENGVAFNSISGGAQDSVIRNSELWGNGVDDDVGFQNGSGIIINNDAVRISIFDNVVRDNTSAMADGVADGPGIKSNSNDELTIIGNRVENNRAYAIDVGRSDRTTIRDNILVDNRGGVLTRGSDMTIEDNAICGGLLGLRVTDAGASVFRHNTVVDIEDHGVTLETGVSGWTVERNIFAFTGGAGIRGPGTAVNRENLYFTNGSGETADGVTRTEPDTDIVGEDPLLDGRETCALRLAEGSPALGAASDGSDLGVR